MRGEGERALGVRRSGKGRRMDLALVGGWKYNHGHLRAGGGYRGPANDDNNSQLTRLGIVPARMSSRFSAGPIRAISSKSENRCSDCFLI